MKRPLYITVILSLILSNYLILFDLDEAKAAGPLAAQVVDYDNADKLLTMPDGSFGSKQQSVTPNEVTISNPSGDPITKVELRDANTHTVLQQMISVGGNKYKVASPLQQQGQIIVGTNDYVTLYPGSFQWFRDPNKKVWMFDYDDSAADGGLTHRFYRNKDNAIYDFPPPTSCLQHKRGMPYGETLPAYPSGYESTVQYCDSAYDYREGTLNVPELNVLSAPTIKLNFNDAVHLEFNTTDFQLDDTGSLKAGNISGLSTDYIDIPTKKFRFNFTTLFSTYPDEDPEDTPDGRILTWYSNWKIKLTGYVYKYPKLEAVAYTAAPTAKVDLTVPTLTGPSCIEAGKSATFKYSITNSGPATSSPFKVKISADGVEIITHTFNGIGTTTEDGTFTYTFSAPGAKGITVFANSDNSLDEQSTNNNSKTESFTASANCNGGGNDPGGCSLGAGCPGEWKGILKVHYPTIEWKNPNDFNVTLTDPANGCTAVTGRFRVSQGNNAFAYAWTPIIGGKDTMGFSWQMGGSSTYPGNIGAGNVIVMYDVEDSCGRISLIGPEPFEIIKVAGAPTVLVDWYKTSTGAKTSSVVQDENVFLKAAATDSKNEKVTLSWTFTGSTSWLAGLPASMGWTSPLNKTQYSNILASVKGTHQVCVTGTNESGISAKACSYLDVIGPEPVAVIDVGGWLKEGRRIELSGEKSSSPRNMTLTYAWTIAPIAGETAGTQAEIEYIQPLSGKLKDFKTPKLGNYLVTLVVTDTEGLTGSATKTVEVKPDLPPIVDIVGNDRAGRDITNRGLATFTVLGTGLSVDQDIITKRLWSFAYDGNNDGIFNEGGTAEIDEDSLVIGAEYLYSSGTESFYIAKTGVHIVELRGQHVGKFNIKLRVVEAPGQPTDLVH
ncbi:CARDB domain-containing protein [Paenibacillus sp. FSL H8-0034]|uniref:CARDB domain-containing protein n=1 Tax=Paenibacillus sp. FSL H8-0034 TaxID=2954671 RepID=UPI0030F94815